MDKVIYACDEMHQGDDDVVGKKCANLGELTSAGFRVPRGFAVSLTGYARFMEETGLRRRVAAYVATLDADPNKTADMPVYEAAEETIRGMVEETPVPADIDAEIRKRYEALCADAGGVISVAVRSAGPASHPGQYESYLHISGADAVVAGVRRVWSSTFNQRSLIARARQKLDVAFDPIGVAVLEMVDAKAAGVMFTANPATGDESQVYIEANWGLGESVVGGEVTPDSFLVAKEGPTILERTINEKKTCFVLDPETGEAGYCDVPDELRRAATISDEELLEIVRVGIEIEAHFGGPQDVEWAVASEEALPQSVMFLQTRPAKHIAAKKDPVDQALDFMMRGF